MTRRRWRRRARRSWPRPGSPPAWRCPALAASGPLGVALVRARAVPARAAQRPRRGASPARVAVACALAGRGLVGARHRRARRRSPARAHRARRAARASSIEGQPRPGPFGSSAIARLDGHPVELRARRHAAAGRDRRGQRPPRAGAAVPRAASTGAPGSHARACTRRWPPARSPCSAGAAASRARSTASAAARAPRSQAGGDDESSRIATGVALGGTATLDDGTRRGVPRIRARAPAGGLGRQRRAAGRRRARPGLARAACRARSRTAARSPRSIAYAAIVGGGPSVVRAAATGVLASLAWLVGSARDPWHLLALAAAAVLALDPWAVAGPGFQLSFVAVAAIHGLAPPIRSWLEGTRRAAAAVRPARDLAGLHARDRPGRARALRPHVARRQPAREPARAARRRAAALARPGVLRRSGRSRPGRRSLLDGAVRALGAYIGLVARLGAWLDGALPGPCCCSSRSPAARSRGSRCRRPAAAFAGALAGLLLALAWPAARASPPPARALRVTFLDVGQGDATLIEAPGTARARRHRPARARASSGSCAGAASLARRALPLARRARPRRPRRGDPARRCSVAAARHARPARAQREPRRPRSRLHVRAARACCAAAPGSCSAAARSSCACSARCTRRRATPTNDAALVSWRARERARSCCRPTPNRRCC